MNKTRITTGEAAALAGVSDDTIARWFDAGLLGGLRLPHGTRRVDLSSLRRLLAESERPGPSRHSVSESAGAR